MSVSAPSRFATSIPSLSPSSTSNYAVHQSVATSPAAASKDTQFTLPAPPTRPPTSNALAHPPRQFAAVSAPAPAQRAHSLPRQRAVAPVGPSPLQRSMTTPGPLSANPYLHLLSIGRKQTQTVQQVNVPRPTPQSRRSATAPTVGKRRYDAEEEERQAKRARIYEFDSAPQAVQTHPLHTIEEVEEPQEKSVLHENKINLAPPSQSVSQKTYVQASKPPRCIKDYVVLRHDNLLTSAAALSESKLLHGDVLFGLPSSLQSQNPIHSIKSAAISQLTMTALSAD
ncbi:hypothetical protein CPB85DRAFT_1301559 [Mucidula mucida]|nr:hypothetical protein CPB85DRAFT_1301559 [Mucidula mucida]